MNLTLEDILRTIAVQNDMRYWEETTVIDEFGRKGIVARMEGKELRIKDTFAFNDQTPNHIGAQQLRFRILAMITTAGLKKLENDAKEFYATHPEHATVGDTRTKPPNISVS